MESDSVTPPGDPVLAASEPEQTDADDERATSDFIVTIRQTGTTFTARPAEPILAAARRAGVWLPFECGWGSCGTCKATLDSGTVELIFPAAPSYDQRDVRRNRVLLCQSVATSDITIKPWRVSEQPEPGFATRDDVAELIKVEELGPAISRFTFRLGAPVEYREGQYAVLQVADGVRRCYSMEDLSGNDTVSFIAKRYEGGVGSEALFDLAEGSSIAIELPYGGMWAAEGTAPLVLVAGGTGISPILAMVRRLVADKDARPIRVYYGARSPAELVAWDELHDLVASLSDGELTGAVVDADQAWAGATGLVTDALVQCAELATDAQVYLAGPPAMVEAVLAVLKSHNVELNRISFDKFG